MEIETPQHLVDLLKQVTLSPKEKLKLNRELANDVRRFFRTQITAQKDIHGTNYKPRKKPKINKKTGRIKKKMFMGLSRQLKTYADKDNFGVGFVSNSGMIAKIHNDGDLFKFKYRKTLFINENLQMEMKEEKVAQGRMPKRQMIGWTKKLEMEMANKIMKHITPS